MQRFENKVVLVTGGGSGMGLAAAQRCAQEGASLAIVGRTEKKLQDAAKTIQADAPKCEVAVIVADVSTQQGNRDMVEKAVTRFGRVDAAFLNAGATPTRSLVIEGLTWTETLGASVTLPVATLSVDPHLLAWRKHNYIIPMHYVALM